VWYRQSAGEVEQRVTFGGAAQGGLGSGELLHHGGSVDVGVVAVAAQVRNV
jgi:hypothetical protein